MDAERELLTTCLLRVPPTEQRRSNTPNSGVSDHGQSTQ
jgi:hypothetical protein